MAVYSCPVLACCLLLCMGSICRLLTHTRDFLSSIAVVKDPALKGLCVSVKALVSVEERKKLWGQETSFWSVR